MGKGYSVALIIVSILGLISHWWFEHEIHAAPTNTILADEVDLQTITFFGKNHTTTKPFDLSDQRIRILYFGYMNCPVVCPTSLASLSAALSQLPPHQLEKFRPIFITLDPERDQVDDTADYAHNFHPNIEGLTASLKDTKLLADHYHLFYKKVRVENSPVSYSIDHTSYFYFTSPNGHLLEQIPHTRTPQPLLTTIHALINQSGEEIQ